MRRPVIVWYHSHTLSSSTRRLAPLWRLLARRLAWAPVSESALDVLRRAHITGPRNTTVVCNPIEPAEVVPTGRAQKTGRDLVVGYLGCENVSKGVLVLPEIAELLRRHPVELVCVMKGWPPERNSDEVNDALDQLRSLSPPVRFRLRDHDVRNIYAELDA